MVRWCRQNSLVRGSRHRSREHEGEAPGRIAMAQARRRFVICVRSGSYRASLQPRKIYRVLDDPKAEEHALLRVVDESGEDYLFPASLFVPIEVPAQAQPAFSRSASPSGISRPARRSSRPTRSSCLARRKRWTPAADPCASQRMSESEIRDDLMKVCTGASVSRLVDRLGDHGRV